MKKFHKAIGANYMKHFNDLNKSPFEDWKKGELVRLLIEHGFELRNEKNLELISLRDLVESLYNNKPVPPKPRCPTIAEKALMAVHAKRIQNFWIDYTVMKRHKAEERASELYIKHMSNIELHPDSEDVLGSDIVDHVAMPDEEALLESEVVIEQLEEGDRQQGFRAQKKKHRINVLDVEWTPPDKGKAELFADFAQPRKFGKGGEKYNYYKTTTGRYCCLGGLGEQFDLWEEGQTSEFSIYGAGITNYFKFLKWCVWVFIVTTVCAMPLIIINVYGKNKSNEGLAYISKTTVGNLVDTLAEAYEENTFEDVRLPGCSSYGLFSRNCSLTPEELGTFYMVIDLTIMAIFSIAYMWLIVFQQREEKLVNTTIVNASMFTLLVKNLPPDATDDTVALHFKKVLDEIGRGDKRLMDVSAVSIGYDNLREIEESFARGDLIKSKVRLVYVSIPVCSVWCIVSCPITHSPLPPSLPPSLPPTP